MDWTFRRETHRGGLLVAILIRGFPTRGHSDVEGRNQREFLVGCVRRAAI